MNRRHFFRVLAGLFGSTLLAKFLPESFWSAWSVPPRGLENPIFSEAFGYWDGWIIRDVTRVDWNDKFLDRISGNHFWEAFQKKVS